MEKQRDRVRDKAIEGGERYLIGRKEVEEESEGGDVDIELKFFTSISGCHAF